MPSSPPSPITHAQPACRRSLPLGFTSPVIQNVMIPWPAQQALLTAFSFITFVLVSIPLYWHLEAWNVGCLLYIAWVGPQCLIQFINGIVWSDNAINWAPVWCDITVRFTWGASHGLLAASLVINRRLYKIATTSSVSITRAEKRRTILVDLAIGLSIPILHIILLWFVQGHRFDIYAGIGCMVAVPNTYLAMVMSNGLAIIIGIVSGLYCVGTIRAFMKRRRQFSELLASNSNLTFNRYIRLMALAAIELVSTIPLASYLFARQLNSPVYQWKGLGDLHWGFSAIHQYPSIIWLQEPDGITLLTMEQWLYITCGLIFFIFFGLAEEARIHYRLAFTTVAKKLGYSTGPSASSGFSSGLPPSKAAGSKLGGISVTIPSFIQRSVHRRGSISSFSDKLSTAISVGDIEQLDDFKEKSYSPSSAGGSSTCISTPIDGIPELSKIELPELARPELVVDVEAAAHTRRHTPDVPDPVHPSDIV